MAARDIEAILRSTLDDPRVAPPLRALAERVLADGDLGPEALATFCARALVLARAARDDPRARHALAWVQHLARLATDDATAPPPTAPARARVAEAFFSPGEDCLRAIQSQFARARRAVDVCVFTITDDRIADAILAAHRRSVQVRVVTDNDKAQDEGSDVERLRRAGIPLRIDATEFHMHHKFAVFDGERILTGSYNWTRSAARHNEENLLVSDEPRLVAPYARQFETLWARLA